MAEKEKEKESEEKNMMRMRGIRHGYYIGVEQDWISIHQEGGERQRWSFLEFQWLA